ncbi:MAG: hypothetical protein ACRD1M_15540, partial [Terriglobales bacterium]
MWRLGRPGGGWRRAGWITAGLAAMLVLAGMAGAQVLNPSLDVPEQPFSYPAYPTGEIGLRGAPQATEITPEGYLYTGYGELMFLLGDPPHPARQRIRTLDQGYLPIVEYGLEDGAVQYQLTLFTAARGPADATGVNIILVQATNSGDTQRTSYFTVALRYTGDFGAHRFLRPVAARRLGAYFQPGARFDPHWIYSFAQAQNLGLAERGGQVMFTFPRSPAPVQWLTPGHLYQGPSTTGGWRQQSVLLAQYALHLAPGASTTLAFQ